MSVAPSSAVMATGAGAPTPELMKDFLKSGIDMMQSEATRTLLRDKLECPDPGKHLIELQRSNWDPLGVDRDLGCKALDELGPGNPSLNQAKQEFVCTAMRTFLLALQDRKPAVLETKKQMTREQFIGFTDACNTKMDLPETQMAMKQYVLENKDHPGPVIIELQREMLEVFGMEREHGCMMLSRIPQDYPEDKELHQRLMMWKRKAEQMCVMIYKSTAQKGGQMSMAQAIQHQLSAPEIKEDADKAREKLKGMTTAEQDEHLKMMQEQMAGMQEVMNLPAEERAEKAKSIEVEKCDVVLSQLIMLSRMQERQEASGAAAGASSATSVATSATPSAAPPSQMMM